MRIVILILILLTNYSFASDFIKLKATDRVNLPNDLYYKDNFVSQWWYFTGHLNSNDGKKFGYELTIFVVNVNNIIRLSPFSPSEEWDKFKKDIKPWKELPGIEKTCLTL
ncbi:MAG: hypothetical protein PWR24_1227 [Desulfonauticus sp.]|nr:hypothetical protein [Desulfonauticus sp.]